MSLTGDVYSIARGALGAPSASVFGTPRLHIYGASALSYARTRTARRDAGATFGPGLQRSGRTIAGARRP